MAEDLDGFVPVGARTIEALTRSVEGAREAERALREALEATLELSEDLALDAVRGLRDRGASAAQIERYEAAHRDRTRATRARLSCLRACLDELDTKITTIAE